MTNLLLADEINRTSPKTQSALLEAMEEGQITVDGITRDLPDPYIVIATQNPFGSIGTHSLPESQLDRFMIRTSLGYPDMESEIKMLAQGSVDMTTSGIEEQISVEELRKAREEAARLFVHEDILRYIVEIANETRRSRDLELGISPRGTIALLSMAKANAYLEGRDYVIPQDVKDVFFETIEHRVIRSKEAKVQRKTKEEILKAILIRYHFQKEIRKDKDVIFCHNICAYILDYLWKFHWRVPYGILICCAGLFCLQVSVRTKTDDINHRNGFISTYRRR